MTQLLVVIASDVITKRKVNLASVKEQPPLLRNEKMQGMKSVVLKLTGLTPLLLHNGRGADPLDPHAKAIKEISAKKKKTEEDFEEMARLEHEQAMYLTKGKDGKLRPCLPSYVLEATAVSGAKASKDGKRAKSGIAILEDAIIETGKDLSNLKDLWKNPDYRLRAAVKVGMSKVMRTRPKFDNWSVKFTVNYNPEILNEQEVVMFFRAAFATGDWRPKYGQFEAEKV